MGFSGALMTILMLIVFGMLAIYLLYQLVLNFQPGRNKIQKDLQELRQLTEGIQDLLIPLDADEMELLSFNQINQRKKRGMVGSQQGTFTSIYHEPVINYAFKNYMSSNKNALILARTADHEYVYRIKGDKVEIMLDGQHLGLLKQDKDLYGGRKKELMAHIDREKHREVMPIQIKGREVGMMRKPEHARAINPRAMEILHDLSDEEGMVLKSLVIFEAVNNQIA